MFLVFGPLMSPEYFHPSRIWSQKLVLCGPQWMTDSGLSEGCGTEGGGDYKIRFSVFVKFKHK